MRDGESWAALVPTATDAAGAYRIFAFHFAEGTNASGFVAWLARLMRSEAGTGAMVVCGYDARATAGLWQTSFGLFDYWGCPWAKGDAVIALAEAGRIKSLVDLFPLERVAEAYEALEAGTLRGRAVVVP